MKSRCKTTVTRAAVHLSLVLLGYSLSLYHSRKAGSLERFVDDVLDELQTYLRVCRNGEIELVWSPSLREEIHLAVHALSSVRSRLRNMVSKGCSLEESRMSALVHMRMSNQTSSSERD